MEELQLPFHLMLASVELMAALPSDLANLVVLFLKPLPPVPYEQDWNLWEKPLREYDCDGHYGSLPQVPMLPLF